MPVGTISDHAPQVDDAVEPAYQAEETLEAGQAGTTGCA